MKLKIKIYSIIHCVIYMLSAADVAKVIQTIHNECKHWLKNLKQAVLTYSNKISTQCIFGFLWPATAVLVLAKI